MFELDGPVAVDGVAEVRQAGILCDPVLEDPRANVNVRDLLGKLIEQDRLIDATRLLAAMLPIRQAVWWSCLCSWHGLRPNPAPQEAAMLRATAAWVVWPLEVNRAAAERSFAGVAVETSAGFCARAAAFAGRLKDRNGPFEPGLTLLAARSAAAAIQFAAKEHSADRSAAWPMLQLGFLIVKGDLRWPTPTWDK